MVIAAYILFGIIAAASPKRKDIGMVSVQAADMAVGSRLSPGASWPEGDKHQLLLSG
jgi:hypothetical protein